MSRTKNVTRRQRLLRNIAVAAFVLILVSMPLQLSRRSGGRNGHRLAADTVAGEDRPGRISIVFGGDVMQHLPQITAARSDSLYDYRDCFKFLKPIFDAADIAVVNLETTLSGKGPYSGYPLFKAPSQLAHALRECGVDVALLANNHICDRGAEGVRSTVKALAGAGLEYTGAFADSADYRTRNPLCLDVKGIRIALLNYTYGTNGLPVPDSMAVNLIDTVRIAADLAKIDMRATDHVIACFHWGEEYARKPSARQKKLAAWCRERGIGFVIGSHPHVVQPVDIMRDSAGRTKGVTAYSLGNLVSNQRSRYTDGGILLKTDIFYTGKTIDSVAVGYIPVWVNTPYRQGRRIYEILPPGAADTMLTGDPAARGAYELFLTDIRNMFRSDTLSGILELK